MRPETLPQAIPAEPFRPFSLILADGTRLPMPHPDFITHPEWARTDVVMGQDESVRVLDVALLLGYEHAPPVPAGTPDESSR
jgi:hypothetical protein